MLNTIEMRWFYPSKIPIEIERWFNQDSLGGQIKSPEDREDWYLYLPNSDYLGIKLRQGKLEIKWRQAELKVLRFGDLVEGKAGKWAKWTCEDPISKCFIPAEVVGKESWLSVKKKRSQRVYQDCTVELTQLQINGKDWWSLAFEATGEDDKSMDNLQAVASQVFQTYRGAGLRSQDSYAYPQWLCSAIIHK
ncbi:hypothetical protein [Coleofasciculus sp. FACHB-T130]|uniref:hypothetical protein n=1 Tax=Cyanophyceae TaxID=3028117 RepID=UPI001687983D|nr:hypothetical protein [Coleofasciculus sp. FACHB-T130]MBD1881067.1 hypothetical protein [Coleofasciculus sp. FACHB-T130]